MHDNPDHEIASPDMKKTLRRENTLYRNALEREIEDLKTQTGRIGKYALIAGGVAVGAYFLYQYFRGDDKTDKDESIATPTPAKSQIIVEKPVKENSVVEYLKEQLAFIAVAILREKLAKFTGIDRNKLFKDVHEPSKSSEKK